MCERLANTASDLLVAHSRLYQPTSERQGFPYDSHDNTTTALYSQPAPPPAPPSSSSMMGTPTTNNATPPTPSTPSDIPYNTMVTLSHAPPPTSAPAPMEQTTMAATAPPELQQPSFQSILASDFSNSQQLNIDFDSLDFLNDSALFGQIMFDARPNNMVPNTLSNAFAYPTMQNFTPDTNTASPTMQGYAPHQPEAWNTQ